MTSWQHAVMIVSVMEMSESAWTCEAIAWVDDEEIYRERLTDFYWSKPLAELGRKGWELVGTAAETAPMGSWVSGIEGPVARPIRMNFFFKRPR